MAKPKTMQLSLLNVKIHPHDTEMYHDMLKLAFESRLVGKIRGSDRGMIGSFQPDHYAKHGIIYGYIYKFLNIDPSSMWLDLSNFETVDPKKTGELPVPEAMKPNLKQIGYVFYPKRHRLFFESSDITPGSVANLFKSLLNKPMITRMYGRVDINVEATKEAIEKIISIPRLTRLVIRFSRPNPDDMSDLENEVQDRILAMNIKNFREEVSTDDDEGLKPDDEYKALMNIGRSNGSVYAVGYDEKQKIERSTEDHPIKERAKYNTVLESETQTMIGFSLRLIKKFFG